MDRVSEIKKRSTVVKITFTIFGFVKKIGAYQHQLELSEWFETETGWNSERHALT